MAGIDEGLAIAVRAAKVRLQHGIAARCKSLGLPVEAAVVVTFGTAVRQDDQGQSLGLAKRRQCQIGMNIEAVGGLVIDGLFLGDPFGRQVGIVAGDLLAVAGGQVDVIIGAGIALALGIGDQLPRIVGETRQGKVLTIDHFGYRLRQLLHQRIEIGEAIPIPRLRKAGETEGRRME